MLFLDLEKPKMIKLFLDRGTGQKDSSMSAVNHIANGFTSLNRH